MKIFLFKNNDTGIEIRTTIKVFCPKGPKIEIVCDISSGLFREKPIIFQGKPEKIVPRSHSKNGSNSIKKSSFSVTDFPNTKVKKKATPQNKDKNAGKPKNTTGTIHKYIPPLTINALLSQYREKTNQPKADKKPMIEASFQFLDLIKKNTGKDRKKINGKRLMGGNENEANKPDRINI